MYFLRLVVKNALRHKLRTTLTIVGIVVAISAFGLLRTVIDAWYAGANASSSARLVTRNAVSLVFSLPPTYLDIYPEFVLSAEERKAFFTDRQGAIVGRKLAEQYGWKIGDQIPLRGTIYSGTWTFNLRGIYEGAEKGTDQ